MSQVIPIDTGDLTSSIDTTGITIWDFVWAIVIVAASFLLAAIVRRLIARGMSQFEGIPENYRLLVARATGWFVIAFGVIYALGVLGVDLGPVVLADSSTKGQSWQQLTVEVAGLQQTRTTAPTQSATCWRVRSGTL